MARHIDKWMDFGYIKRRKNDFWTCQKKSHKISKKTYEKIMNNFNCIENYKEEEQVVYKKLLNAVFSNQRNIYSGYEEFDLGKTENIISYIASKVKNFTLTSLNKYLWFVDMMSYKERVLAITGLSYQKQQYGPVIAENLYNELSMLNDKYY